MAKRSKARTTAKPADATSTAGIGVRRNSVDSVQNLISGMGTDKDKMFNTFFGFGLMARDQLDAAYRGDWISRKGVDIPAEDATREWREWQADPDDVTKLETLEKDLSIQQKVKQAIQRGRLYGGGALVLGIAQGKPEEEVNLELLDTDCLEFVHVVSRYELANGPLEWDITSPYYGEPQYYTQNNQGGGAAIQVHPSRVVRFIGQDIPDLVLAQGWGDSILQSVSDAVMAAGMVSSSVAQMVGEAKIDVIRIPGLSENIVSQAYEDRLKKRFGFANTVKSVFSMLLLDKEEEWQRINSSFANLDDVLKMYLLIVSGALDIPATRFLGQSPAGMSATGDSDTRNYYDRISTDQKTSIQPRLSKLDEVLMRSALGKMPERGPGDKADVYYNWRPLWQMSDTDKAAVALQKSQVMTADMTAGLINTVVLKKAREAQLESDGTYPGLEQLIEEFDDDPELEQQQLEEKTMQNRLAGGAVVTDPEDPNYDPQKDPNSPKYVPPEQVPSGEPKQLAPPKKSSKKTAPPKKDSAAINGIVRRLQDATTPRTLYVRRDLINQDDLKAWAKEAGFATSLTDMHVTIAYSKQEVDWLAAGADSWGQDAGGNLTVNAGGPRVLERFGNAVVLAFANSDLSYRHMRIREGTGATWSYDDYTPHVTITYEPGDVDISALAPYNGVLKFGPEIFQEIKPGFDNERDTVEDYNHHHGKHGQFSGAGPDETAGEGGRTDLVRHLSTTKHTVAELKKMHSLIPSEVSYLKRLRSTKSDGMDRVIDAITNMPPPQVNVTVPVTVKDAKRGGKEVTRVTKHDARGRIQEFERTGPNGIENVRVTKWDEAGRIAEYEKIITPEG